MTVYTEPTKPPVNTLRHAMACARTEPNRADEAGGRGGVMQYDRTCTLTSSRGSSTVNELLSMLEVAFEHALSCGT